MCSSSQRTKQFYICYTICHSAYPIVTGNLDWEKREDCPVGKFLTIRAALSAKVAFPIGTKKRLNLGLIQINKRKMRHLKWTTYKVDRAFTTTAILCSSLTHYWQRPTFPHFIISSDASTRPQRCCFLRNLQAMEETTNVTFLK